MNLDRRRLLQLGGLFALTGCTASELSPTTGTGTPQPSSSGSRSTSAPSATPTAPGIQPRDVPAPAFQLAKAPTGGIDGKDLERTLAALPTYRGGTQRRIVVKAGTYTVKRPIRIPSGVHLVAGGSKFVSAIPGAQEPLVAIDNARDITIEGGTWDGNSGKVKVVTEWKHVIRVQNSSRITLKNLVTQNARGDGIYLGTHDVPCRDVTLESVKSQKNHRNGMSVTSCIGLTCSDSIFSANGSTSPMAGVDIEPNDPGAPIRDFTFRRCAFSDNTARGFLVVMDPDSPELPGSIRLQECTIERNGTEADSRPLWAGVTLLRPRGVKITKSLIRGNNIGISVQGRRGRDGKDQLNRGTLVLDGLDVTGSSREGLLVLQGIRKLDVSDSRFFTNSQEEDGYFSGILLANGSNMAFTDCVSTGARMFGLQAAPKVRKVVLTRCDLSGNDRGEMDAPKAGVKVVN